MLARKGDDKYNYSSLFAELQRSGYPRVVVRSDGEPALKTHIDGARNLLALNCETQMLREVVSKGQSPGNGLAEGAVKEIKAKVRTFRFELEARFGRPILDTHDSLAWLAMWAATSIN